MGEVKPLCGPKGLVGGLGTHWGWECSPQSPAITPPLSQRRCPLSGNSSLSTSPPAGILRSQRRRPLGHVPSHLHQSCSTWASLPAPMASTTSWLTSSPTSPGTSCTGDLSGSERSPSSALCPLSYSRTGVSQTQSLLRSWNRCSGGPQG